MSLDTYTVAVLHFYQDSTFGYDTFNFRDAPDAEPRTMARVTLYGALDDGNSKVIGGDDGSVGWHTDTVSVLLSPKNWPPPQSGGELVISWIDANPSLVTTNYGNAEGAGQANPPWIQFF
jgi:hypothetical protein